MTCYLILKCLIFNALRGYNFIPFLLWKILWISCCSNIFHIEFSILLPLTCCLSILCGWIFHYIDFLYIFGNFHFGKILVVSLCIFYYLGFHWFVMFSVFVLSLRYKIHTKLINFSPQCKGTFIWCKIIFYRWIISSPSHDLIHCWVEVSQVLLLTK